MVGVSAHVVNSTSGTADLLRRQAERRFDAETARRLSALLIGIEADRLIEVGDWFFLSAAAVTNFWTGPVKPADCPAASASPSPA